MFLLFLLLKYIKLKFLTFFIILGVYTLICIIYILYEELNPNNLT